MSIRNIGDFNAGIADGVLKERARVLALLDSYESQCSLQVVAMAAEGVGDPAAVQAQLGMLRLLREVLKG